MNTNLRRRRGVFSAGLVASPAVTWPAGRSRRRRVPTRRIWRMSDVDASVPGPSKWRSAAMSHGRQNLGTPCEIVGRRGLISCDARCGPPVEELRKYGYERESDADYRHRMRVNFLATV